MSLIQEALDKAGSARKSEPFFETPKRAPVQPVPLSQKINKQAVFAQAAVLKSAAQIQISPQVLIRISAAAALILFLGAAAFFLGRTGKSSVMLTGVSSAASESSVLPVSDAAAVKFVLTGITDSGDGKLAVINNQVVAVGDRLLEKAFVKEIQPRSVTLDYDRKEIKLTL